MKNILCTEKTSILSYRIIKGGYKNYYFPKARIIHYKGESTKKTSINYVFIFYKAMIIFARKHFSHNKAALFSFLINIAIYIKAGIDIFIRFISRASLTLFDITFMYLAMSWLTDYWEANHKFAPSKYPEEFMSIVVPCYVLIWLLSNYFSGGNDKPIKVAKIIRGIFIGTILISALTNFIDSYRFSKALILLGGFSSSLILIVNRLIFHFIKYNNFTLDKNPEKRVALIGNHQESERVLGLLREMHANVNVIGFITPVKNGKHEHNLGALDQLSEILEIYKLDEIIFCSKDISANQIIELMVNIDKRYLDYKIVPDESNYVIGSNSKNRPGDFYTIEIKLNIILKNNIRNKRVFDICVSLICLAFSPILVFIIKNPVNFIKNALKVLFGVLSWVGFSEHNHVHLPKMKKGVLTPSTNMLTNHLDENTIKRLDTIYAKEYSVGADIEIILKSISKLGS